MLSTKVDDNLKTNNNIESLLHVDAAFKCNGYVNPTMYTK